MAVLVRVKLLRQFAIELGELVWLHLAQAANQHLMRGVQEFEDEEHLVSVIRRVLGRLIQVLVGHVESKPVDLLLHGLVSSLFVEARRSASAWVSKLAAHFGFHFFLGFREHLFLHLSIIGMLFGLSLLDLLLPGFALVLSTLAA